MLSLTKLYKGTVHSKVSSGQRIFVPVEKEGLVLYLPMEEDSGNIVYDESKNDNNGTIYGATRVDGQVGKALSFNGIDNYVRIANASNLQITGDISLQLWIEPSEVISANTSIIGKWNMDNKRSYFLYVLASSALGGVISELGTNSPENYSYTVSSNGLIDTSRQRITMTFKASTGRLELYRNGAKVSDTYLYENANSIYVSTVDVTIGASFDAIGILDRFFKGIADEPKIFNRILTEEEIENSYRREK